jgi:hypothetical protein
MNHFEETKYPAVEKCLSYIPEDLGPESSEDNKKYCFMECTQCEDKFLCIRCAVAEVEGAKEMK